jgi:peptidoglycan LD-endopeptidase LytH
LCNGFATRALIAGMILATFSLSAAAESRNRQRTVEVTIDELERILRERSERNRRPVRHSGLVMPVVGVEPHDLRDSYGDPRSGGRSHQGVDIFAPRWTEVVAVTRGRIEAVGNGGLGGRTIWLRGDDGRAYYYAHLQSWADGLRNGMRVGPGQLIGFVGNSGNARSTATHLHFEVRSGRRTTNPYYVLADATPVNRSNDRVAVAEHRSIWQRIFGR